MDQNNIAVTIFLQPACFLASFLCEVSNLSADSSWHVMAHGDARGSEGETGECSG